MHARLELTERSNPGLIDLQRLKIKTRLLIDYFAEIFFWVGGSPKNFMLVAETKDQDR